MATKQPKIMKIRMFLVAIPLLTTFPSLALDVPQEIHDACIKATDYKGCVGANNSNDAEEEVRTGILWDSAKWKNNNNTVRIKVYRQRGGGLWMGNSMRLSIMEVHCKTAEFDVQSDGYKQQSIEGDAYRQAPLIFARLCTKPLPETENL